MKSLFFRTMVLAACAVAVSCAFTSCTGVVSGLTGQKVHATPVKREAPEAKPVNVATTDLLQAEAGPAETVYGLYDVGAVAGAVAQVRDSGK